MLTILGGLNFANLALEREAATGRLLYAPAPLAEMCRAAGMGPDATFADEDLACWLICEWYVTHREAGGEPHPVAEQILAEVAEEQENGIAMLQESGAHAH